MTCYVDALRPGTVKGCRAKWWCHLIADTLEELHAMADRIGMHRTWFQAAPPASFPHYDLTPSRQALAVSEGARALDRLAFVTKLRELRQTKEYSRTPMARPPERAS